MGFYNTKMVTWIKKEREGSPWLNMGLLPKEETEQKGYVKMSRSFPSLLRGNERLHDCVELSRDVSSRAFGILSCDRVAVMEKIAKQNEKKRNRSWGQLERV